MCVAARGTATTALHLRDPSGAGEGAELAAVSCLGHRMRMGRPPRRRESADKSGASTAIGVVLATRSRSVSAIRKRWA
jgi:hypothetical protein